LEKIQKPRYGGFFNSKILKNWNQRFCDSIFFHKTGIGSSAILLFFIKLELEVLLFLKFMRITRFFMTIFKTLEWEVFLIKKILKNLNWTFWNSENFHKIETRDS